MGRGLLSAIELPWQIWNHTLDMLVTLLIFGSPCNTRFVIFGNNATFRWFTKFFQNMAMTAIFLNMFRRGIYLSSVIDTAAKHCLNESHATRPPCNSSVFTPGHLLNWILPATALSQYADKEGTLPWRGKWTGAVFWVLTPVGQPQRNNPRLVLQR